MNRKLRRRRHIQLQMSAGKSPRNSIFWISSPKWLIDDRPSIAGCLRCKAKYRKDDAAEKLCFYAWTEGWKKVDKSRWISAGLYPLERIRVTSIDDVPSTDAE
ncbi:hypothetical protein TNCV_3147621 [Trichonephila clavipes]|nr:hypothetical protein TNCV_3147621 [Trichonephila clavipes]